MKTHIRLGLIGKNISYSFSQKYFTEKFKKLFLKNHSYETYHLENINEVMRILENDEIKGFNVTIPYKEAIIPYLDDLSEEAKMIGAVNTVSKINGKWIGYNTDAYGFEQMLKIHRKDFQNNALVLGNGGASKAIQFVLNENKIPFQVISRTTEINYENLSEKLVNDSLIIIQCTPVGTFPNVEDCLKFPFEAISDKHLVIDLIYNPSYTAFIKNATNQGAKCVNGFFMLEQQAEKAWQIWNENL